MLLSCSCQQNLGIFGVARSAYNVQNVPTILDGFDSILRGCFSESALELCEVSGLLSNDSK